MIGRLTPEQARFYNAELFRGEDGGGDDLDGPPAPPGGGRITSLEQLRALEDAARARLAGTGSVSAPALTKD